MNDSFSPVSPTERLAVWFSSISHHLALLVAWVAMCGSLYFSEVLRWQPCVLCWYQRILMYPLALLIAVGLLQRDTRVHRYVFPQALLGACFSLYHYLLIKTDWLPPPPCVDGVPCTVDYLNIAGFINIPFLALVAFLLISFFMLVRILVPTDPDLNDELGENAQPIAARGLFGLGVSDLAVFGIIVGVVGTFIAASRS